MTIITTKRESHWIGPDGKTLCGLSFPESEAWPRQEFSGVAFRSMPTACRKCRRILAKTTDDKGQGE